MSEHLRNFSAKMPSFSIKPKPAIFVPNRVVLDKERAEAYQLSSLEVEVNILCCNMTLVDVNQTRSYENRGFGILPLYGRCGSYPP